VPAGVDTKSFNSDSFDTVIAREGTSSMKWERYGGADVLPMWVADMDFAVAPPIQAALQSRLEHPIYGYGIVPTSLTEAVVEHAQREYGWAIDPDWLVFMPGVVPGLAVSCRAWCETGDALMVNPPIYHHFFDAHEEQRHQLLRVPLQQLEDRWTFDLERMESEVTRNTKLLMICSPQNPSGTVFTRDELSAVADFCERHNLILISDEIHCDLLIDQRATHVPTALAAPNYSERVVTLMSASKTWNIAGLNCSFAVIENAALRERFRLASKSIVSLVPPLASVATEAALRHGGPWRAALLDYLWDNFKHLEAYINRLPGLSVSPMQATYLAWVDATGLGLDDATGFFERHGLGLSSGESFGQPHYVRLNFACPRTLLDEGLARMQAAVNTLHTR